MPYEGENDWGSDWSLRMGHKVVERLSEDRSLLSLAALFNPILGKRDSRSAEPTLQIVVTPPPPPPKKKKSARQTHPFPSGPHPPPLCAAIILVMLLAVARFIQKWLQTRGGTDVSISLLAFATAGVARGAEDGHAHAARPQCPAGH